MIVRKTLEIKYLNKWCDRQNNKIQTKHHHNGGKLIKYYIKTKTTTEKPFSASVADNLVNTKLQAGLFDLLNWKIPARVVWEDTFHTKREAGTKNRKNGPLATVKIPLTEGISTQKHIYGSVDFSFIEFRSVQV